VAQALNDCGVNVVSVQFEPSIWGGQDGAYVLDFIRALRVPMVATLHNVLAHPTPAQREILIELVDTAAATVVMSRTAAGLLTSAYGIDDPRTEIIPYGVSALPLIAPDTIKPKLSLQGKTVILSFGLLGPGKGFETVIDAMPAIVEAVPSARYIILGATSPETVGSDGEAYRVALEKQAAGLGMTEQVKFVDRFVGRVELGTWLEAADVFVAPCPDLDQTVSGTVAYAMGAGKAIVSTPSRYATEILADGRGRLVPPASPAAFAAAITELLTDTELRASMGKLAYDHSRGMVWWEVGRQYRSVFDRAACAAVDMPASPRRKLAAVVA
jgi:glycosyltransferase involved in cell wall biosynthesis